MGQANDLFLGSDHAGFELKNFLLEKLPALRGASLQIHDLGTFSKDSVDYPDFAQKVALQVASNPNSLGILICGSGIGVSIAANKVVGIRAAHCESVQTARLSRAHNDANILCLGERITPAPLALEMAQAWLDTAFEGGRHQNRVTKIHAMEQKK